MLLCCLFAEVSTEAGRGGSGNTWPLYCDWALASHVVEYASIIFEYMQHYYIRYYNNIGTNV